MNWMANSKNRMQKRRSTAVNLQRGYFARNNTLPSVQSQRELAMHLDSNLSQQQEKFGLLTSQREFRPISNGDKSCHSGKVGKGSKQTIRSLKDGIDSAYSQPRLIEEFQERPSEAPKAFQATPISNSLQRTDVAASKTQKAYCGKRRSISHFEEGEHLHPDADLLETIDRLMKVISEQKKRIKLLEERCSRYECEQCACSGRRLQAVDSGGPPSFQGSVEESPNRAICNYQDGMSSNRDQVYSIPRSSDSRVEIKFCAGTISCANTSNQRPNNTFNLMDNYYVDTDTTRKLLFLHCSLDKRSLPESDYRQVNSIQQAVLNVQENVPLLIPQRLPTMSRVELINQ